MSSYASVARASNTTSKDNPQHIPVFPAMPKPSYSNNFHTTRKAAEASSTSPSSPRYQPDPSHLPQTGREETSSYVLTLTTSSEIHEAANALRQKYFPPRLNRIPAHVTLFRALPGSKLDMVRQDLSELSASCQPFKISTGSIKRLKRGVAIFVNGTKPVRVTHTQLKEKWFEWLSQQDRGGFQGHYTVMNKVEDENVIENAVSEIEKGSERVEGEARGLTLWRYERGRWKMPEDFAFTYTASIE